jgi:hypothetical protein
MAAFSMIDFLEAHTVAELGADEGNILELNTSDTSFLIGFEKLLERHVLSAPVYNVDRKGLPSANWRACVYVRVCVCVCVCGVPLAKVCVCSS